MVATSYVSPVQFPVASQAGLNWAAGVVVASSSLAHLRILDHLRMLLPNVGPKPFLAGKRDSAHRAHRADLQDRPHIAKGIECAITCRPPRPRVAQSHRRVPLPAGSPPGANLDGCRPCTRDGFRSLGLEEILERRRPLPLVIVGRHEGVNRRPDRGRNQDVLQPPPLRVRT